MEVADSPRKHVAQPPPPIPGWARLSGPLDPQHDPSFLTGACLAHLDAWLRQNPGWSGVWRQRLALNAAAATMRFLGRREDAFALRDLWQLRRDSDTLDPAGQVFAGWILTGQSGRDPVDAAKIREAAACFGVSVAGIDVGLEQLVSRAGQGTGSPVKAAADLVAAVVRLKPQAEVLAYWLADHVLARRLNWPFALPLLIASIKDPRVRAGADRAPRPGEGGWERTVALAAAKSAATAADLAGDLARKAENLVALAPKSRSRAGRNVAQVFLERDAIAASAKFSGMSDRGLRRLCDRLVELGAIREFTGRPTFRLYGL